MNSRNISKSEQIKYLDDLKSTFIFKKIFDNMEKNKSFLIMKYNKKLQKRLNLNIDDYKECSQLYSSIEIELKIGDNKFGQFINIPDKDRKYYHIYFDNFKKEIKRCYLKDNEKVQKIKIIINYHVNSFEGLFFQCDYINSIFF